jgi:hypothetical protein
MSNPVKIMFGTIVGAGIGMAVSRAMERSVPAAQGAAPSEPKETLAQRWERAKTAGEAAKEAKEAELRAYFRQKVDDPTALQS